MNAVNAVNAVFVFHDFNSRRGSALVALDAASLRAAFEAHKEGRLGLDKTLLAVPAAVHPIDPAYSNYLWDECPQGAWLEYRSLLPSATVVHLPQASTPSCMVIEVVHPDHDYRLRIHITEGLLRDLAK